METMNFCWGIVFTGAPCISTDNIWNWQSMLKNKALEINSTCYTSDYLCAYMYFCAQTLAWMDLVYLMKTWLNEWPEMQPSEITYTLVADTNHILWCEFSYMWSFGMFSKLSVQSDSFNSHFIVNSKKWICVHMHF